MKYDLDISNNYKQYNLPGDDWMSDIIIIKQTTGLRNIFTS